MRETKVPRLHTLPTHTEVLNTLWKGERKLYYLFVVKKVSNAPNIH